jgi:hypothetical protein
MFEVLSRLTPGDLAAVLVVVSMIVVVGLVSVISVVVTAIQRQREREVAASVVSEMLDRGAAPQDIVAVLKAMGSDEPPARRLRGWLRRSRRAGAQTPMKDATGV